MPDVVSEYRELLTSEESIPHLDGAIRLAVRIASGEGSDDEKRWQKVLNGQAPSFVPSKTGKTNTQRLKRVAWLLSDIPRRIAKSVAEVPDDQYSLLMDTLLLVF